MAHSTPSHPARGQVRPKPWGRWFLIGTPYLWLCLFFLLPCLIVFKISMSELQDTGIGFIDMVSVESPRHTGKLPCTEPLECVDEMLGAFDRRVERDHPSELVTLGCFCYSAQYSSC